MDFNVEMEWCDMANELNNAIMQALAQTRKPSFMIRPQLREMPFDPTGTGYDYETAIRLGMSVDPMTKHWGSRVELPEEEARVLGLPAGSGIMLKGAGHETWDKALAGEAQAGFSVIQGRDGRYYSVPKQR